MSLHTAKHPGFRLSLRRAQLPLAAALLMTAAPAFVEGNTATTMMPPAPNASESAYQSESSLPENAETSTYNSAGTGLAMTSSPGQAVQDGGRG